MLNRPFCEASKRMPTKIVAYLDIVFTLFGLLLYFLLMIYPDYFSNLFEDIPHLRVVTYLFLNNTNNEREGQYQTQYVKDTIQEKFEVVDLSLKGIVVFLVDIWVATRLLNGAKNYTISDVSFWFKIRLGCLLIGVVLYIFYALEDLFVPIQEIYFILLFVFRAFGLWIVAGFLKEIGEGREMQRLGNIFKEFGNDDDDKYPVVEYNKLPKTLPNENH